METSGNLITVLAELTAGMKDCKHDLKGRTVLLLMLTCRDASSVILYCYRIILVDEDLNAAAKACKGLVNTIINYLIYKMMKTSFTDISIYIEGLFLTASRPSST